ncbi:unannotated protein [freshwater metagenome]|uniref:Unannotated protein n=1 Tax=freshwater metagenome TaxID=449393 RepID=A0A6J7HZW3_9ZZZZ|nr:insulinase family protein [Actinomycetota bacterium]
MTEPAGHHLTTLPSGVRVVTESMAGARSVALGIMIGAGSVAESGREAGWSHLLEHLLFRGSARYGSREIDERFDAFGGEIDAGTGRESTSLSARVLDEHLEEAFDIMADMVWRPGIAPADVASEQQIVLEELAMYEDDPQDVVFDLLGAAVFGAHPIGRPVIGTRESVSGADSETLRAYHAERYAPGSIVISAAGSVVHERIVELVAAAEQADVAGRRSVPAPAPPTPEAPRALFRERPTEQFHITFGAHGLAREDDRRIALRVLDALVGGTPSSRLFQEVRERRSLAYDVSSFHSEYAGVGHIGIYLGTRPANLEAALGAVVGELERLRADGLAPGELDRAREHAKGRFVLALESPYARMGRLGALVLHDRELLEIDTVLARVDALQEQDIESLAAELLDPARLSVAAVGPDEARFRAALDTALPGPARMAA